MSVHAGDRTHTHGDRTCKPSSQSWPRLYSRLRSTPRRLRCRCSTNGSARCVAYLRSLLFLFFVLSSVLRFCLFSLFFVSSNSLLKKKNPGMFGRVCRPRAWLPRATDGGIRMTLPTTGRRVGHCGEHTAKLESATSGDSPCDHIMRRCLWHVRVALPDWRYAQ